MRELDARLEVKLSSYGIYTTLIETARNNAWQMKRWLQGRNEYGEIVDRRKIVTWKKPGDSLHNLVFPDGTPCSLAAHRAIRITLPNGKPGLLGFGESKLDKIAIDAYKVLGRIAISLGLRWGGNWDMDEILAEPGEDDFTHNEKVLAPLGLVKAALLAGQNIIDLRRA